MIILIVHKIKILKRYEMNNRDLEYLLNNNPFKYKNYYKDVPTSNLDIQESYLKSSVINHKKIKAEKSIRNRYQILDLNDNSIFELRELQYPNNGKNIRKLVEDKLKTEKYISQFGINTPQSKVYHMSEREFAKQESFTKKDKIVIKPLSSSRGRGVQVNVTKDRFDINWDIVKKALRLKNEYILVQNVVEGFEARATIIEGELLSIMVRVPPYVTGNGKNTISELIEVKNNDREKCDFRKDMLITQSETNREFIEAQGMNFDYIPADEENILLNSISNIAYGGETINITGLVCKEIKEEALNAMGSIPNLNTCGIDIMMTSFDDSNPVILEINSYPFLSIPYLPTYGKGRNPTKFYVESLVAMHQKINQPSKRYHIENEDRYISNYLSLNKRRQDLINKVMKNLPVYK